jgi:DNA-binding transcriptional MerR regulator
LSRLARAPVIACIGADVERLYRVAALRGVGMALDEIRAVLDDAGVSLMDTVRRHIAAVERDSISLTAVRGDARSQLDA